MASHIQIYAEQLPNIRQVSVSVVLPLAGMTKATTAEVLADGVTLQVRQDGVEAALRLPGTVAVGGRRLGVAAAAVPGTNAQELSWRMPLRDSMTTTVDTSDIHDLAQWSARDLPVGAAVGCRRCRSVVVAAGRTTVYKDLPSDNWAEMMEFWHCHKPEHRHNEAGKTTSEGLAARGYGANSAITAQAGVGFVDLIALVFAHEDCQGIVFSASSFQHGAPTRPAVETTQPPSTRGLNVFCAACHVQVGYYNFAMQSVTLFKWQIQLATTSAQPQPSLSECLAATLITTTARSGSSRSLILPIYGLPAASPAADVLHVWVLNSNIRYASTSNGNAAPVLAMKLLYKFVTAAEADRMIEALNTDVQEINLPEEAISAVVQTLEQSNAVLPVRERQFKEWKIGLLPRWEAA